MRARAGRLAAAAALAAGLAGCSLLGAMARLRTFTKCQFRLAGVADTRLAGVDIQNRRSLNDLGALDALKLAAALRGGSIPLTFNVIVEVKNPNPDPAEMSGLEWILLVDGTEFTRGAVTQPVVLEGNGSGNFLLMISVDLRQVLTGASLDALTNLAFNVAGEGKHPTHVSAKLKPSIRVAGAVMPFPDYLVVSADFGGPESFQESPKASLGLSP